MFKFVFNFVRHKIQNMTAEELSNVFREPGFDIDNKIQQKLVLGAMKSYAKIKCQELLLLVAEKARIIEDGDVDNPYEEYFLDLGGFLRVDKDSILNAVDLEKFCS